MTILKRNNHSHHHPDHNEGILSRFLKCVQDSLDSVSGKNFFIVGKDPDDELKSLSSDSITITGMVDSVDVYYKNAGLVVVPLKHGGGVKVKLLEAIGNKVPVISTSIGVQGTMFNSENMIVADSAENFANKCVDFLKNRNNFQSQYQKVFDVFEKNYTWEAIGENYNKILCNLNNTFPKHRAIEIST